MDNNFEYKEFKKRVLENNFEIGIKSNSIRPIIKIENN